MSDEPQEDEAYRINPADVRERLAARNTENNALRAQVAQLEQRLEGLGHALTKIHGDLAAEKRVSEAYRLLILELVSSLR